MNILLDDTGDWAVTDGQVQTVTGLDEIGQKIKNRLRAFEGEWFLDIRVGLPWFSKILKKGANGAEVEALITDQIVNTPGVINIREILMSLDNTTRKLTVSFQAQTTDGILNFSEVI